MTARKKPNLNLRRFIRGLPNIFLNAFVRFRVETAKFRCLISLKALLLASVFEIIVNGFHRQNLFDSITILNYETVIITHNLIQYLSANFHKAVNITTFVSMLHIHNVKFTRSVHSHLSECNIWPTPFSNWLTQCQAALICALLLLIYSLLGCLDCLHVRLIRMDECWSVAARVVNFSFD